MPYTGEQLDRIFALHHDRVVGHDNGVEFGKHRWQIPPASWRYRFAKGRVKVYEHLDGTLRIGYRPHTLAHSDAEGRLLLTPQGIISPNGRRGQITLNNRTDHWLQKPDILTCY